MPIDKEAFFKAIPAQFSTLVSDFDWEPDLISTDSRHIPPNGIFIPLQGENHDGHNYISKALTSGARLAFCQENYFQAHQHELANLELVRVADTHLAYQMLARQWRRQMGIPIVGITGSSGKTSTKELLATVLAPFFKVHKNKLNFNNQIGVPKTLLELKPNDQIGIVEMGMRGLGQISELTTISEPQIGLLTHIGTAHLSELGSQAKIAQAKWELAEYLSQNQGLLFAQSDDPWQRTMAETTPQLNILWCGSASDSYIRLLDCQAGANSQIIVYQLPDGTSRSVELTLPGPHQARNLMLCLGYLYHLGHVLAEGFRIEPEQLSGRNEEIVLSEHITIINDAYNANPDSMRAALTVFAARKKTVNDARKIVVLGKMGELGSKSSDFHFELGNFCQELPLDLLCVIGTDAQAIAEGAKGSDFEVLFFNTNQDCAAELNLRLKQHDTVFFKGSRSAQLENVISALNVPLENASK
jgi:UDP-N-acetylmuramoyl-tripeptide--D-alanyl-D-alanine ligase